MAADRMSAISGRVNKIYHLHFYNIANYFLYTHAWHVHVTVGLVSHSMKFSSSLNDQCCDCLLTVVVASHGRIVL